MPCSPTLTSRQWRDRVWLRKITIDALKVAKRLREAGFSEPQAEAVVAAVQEGTARADLATTADLAELRSELRETELRLEAKIEAVRSDISGVKADILNRVFGMILGTLVFNIVAVVGAMFALAKLVAH